MSNIRLTTERLAMGEILPSAGTDKSVCATSVLVMLTAVFRQPRTENREPITDS